MREVKEAIDRLARRKTAGMDELPGEVYENLLFWLPRILDVIKMVLKTGAISRQMLNIIETPADKPKRYQSLCKSERPAALINVISKFTKAVAQDRIVGVGGSRLDGRQYVYTRNTSTETHPSEFHDFAREAEASAWRQRA